MIIKGLPKELYPTEPVLRRPLPWMATAQDIVAALRAITDYDSNANYSYGHIVIDDYNLGDGSINHCLYASFRWDEARHGWKHYESVVRSDFRRRWVEQGVTDAFWKGVDVKALEPWDQAVLAPLLELDAEVCRFLRWLRLTSEDERDEAEVILRGE